MKTHPWKNRLTALAVFGLAALGTLLGPTRPAQAALQQRVVAGPVNSGGGTFLKVAGSTAATGTAEAGAGLLLFALMALSGGRRSELA